MPRINISPRIGLWLRVVVHVASLLPLIWLFWAVPSGKLGGDPVQELTHFLGLGALRLLLLSLCITPLAKWLKAGVLIRLRRPLGLWCFAYATLHFAVWISLDLQFFWNLIGSEIIERNYLLVGFAAWLILLPLAITSIPKLQRAMGPRWKKLHNWVYLVAILAPVHYLWSVKSGLIEPLMYLFIALFLLWFRRERLLKPIVKRLPSAPARQ